MIPAVDGTLAALADPVRRRTIELLAERPRPAGELADAVGTSAPTMSKHLRVLREQHLVVEERDAFDARVRVYSLRSAAMSELRDWIDATEAAWAAQLTAFADYLDRTADEDPR